MRFNKKDEYNVPVGKVDFVESLRKKTIDYCAAIKNKKIQKSVVILKKLPYNLNILKSEYINRVEARYLLVLITRKAR